MWFEHLKEGFSANVWQEDATPHLVETDHAARGADLETTVPAGRVAAAAQVMYEAMFSLESVTGMDWIAENRLELVYDYVHFETGRRVTLRASVPREDPELPTISMIYPGAEWHEREARDFFGFTFIGHPDPTPLLLPEDADFHPLRKDFAG
jgi:NADH-quinone oxidoreductase subunit C